MTSAIPVQCSTNWANKPSGSWSICWVQINHPNDDNTGVQIYEFHISKIIIQDLLKFEIISFILVILTVLSMRFEVGGYLSKVLHE